QMVKIFGGGFARMNLVLYTIQTGHHQGGECQVWVGSRGWETCFDTTCLVAMYKWYTDRRRTVLGRISQFHWSLKARHQALVGVGAWVGDCVQCACVLDNTADVVKGEIAQAS